MPSPELAKDLKSFYASLTAFLAAHGFQREDHEGEVGFWCWGESRSLVFGIGVVDYTAKVHIAGGAAVRFEEIETICGRATGLPAEVYRETWTVDLPGSSEYVDLRSGLGRVVLGLDGIPVTNAVARIEGMFTSAALPFYESVKTLSDVDKILNNEPHLLSPYLRAEFERACRGLAAAKLAGRANIEELLAIYTKQMRTIANGWFLPRFEQLVKDLGLQWV